MALAEVCLAMAQRLRLLPGFDAVPDEPMPMLPDDRMLLIYPNVGASTPRAHAGSTGKALIEYRDTVIVEAHLKIATDEIEAGIRWATPMLDRVRDGIWSEATRNKFGGTITQLFSITTTDYGELGWGDQPTFGFRLAVEVSHHSEVSA